MNKEILRVGIQGVKASFHDVATRTFFRQCQIETLESPSFRHLCQLLKSESSQCAVMAIENTSVGSLLANLSLLREFQLRVVGEVIIRIEMSLMALPNQKLSDISVVRSHPVALGQCDQFLSRHAALRPIETSDTAESAKHIFDNQLKGEAAIAHHLAASEYGLSVLERGIESSKNNYTRFWIICGAHQLERFNSYAKNSDRLAMQIPAQDFVSTLQIISTQAIAQKIRIKKVHEVPRLENEAEGVLHFEFAGESVALARFQESVERAFTQTMYLGSFNGAEKSAEA